MYIPKIYEEEDRSTLLAFIQSHSFGILITSTDDVPFASHLPFMLDDKRGEQGALLSHLARANPQWRRFEAGREVLVIFHGPHSYISPSWYTSELNVPTWNYAVVHAYGTIQIIEDEMRVRRVLDDLVAIYEAKNPRPWVVDWDEVSYERLIAGIVAFEIEITRLEGKFKLNQNKSSADRRQVAQHLQSDDDPQQSAVADFMLHQLASEEQKHV